MAESLGPISFQLGIPGDTLFPLGVDVFPPLVIVESRVCMWGREYSLLLFHKGERFLSRLRNGHSLSVIIDPLPEAL